jgi:glycosyltransferase involved in cell wall biosynthesis
MVFSVIIPVYNVELYLRECVDSLLNQTFLDYEIILVDDGSTDTSGFICDDYALKHKQISVIHQENGGSAEARNSGLSLAAGEYIIYVDSDDFICDKYFFKDLANKASSGYDVILYRYKKYFEKTGAFGIDSREYPSLECAKNSGEIIFRLLNSGTFEGSAWSKAVRRKVLFENGLSFMKGLISEDTDWYFGVLQNAKSYTAVNKVYLVYRQRKGSLSKSPKLKSLSDNIYIINKWLKVANSVPDQEHRLAEAIMAALGWYSANLCIIYGRINDPKKKVYIKDIAAFRKLMLNSVNRRSKIIGIFSTIFGIRVTLCIMELLDSFREQ